MQFNCSFKHVTRRFVTYLFPACVGCFLSSSGDYVMHCNRMGGSIDGYRHYSHQLKQQEQQEQQPSPPMPAATPLTTATAVAAEAALETAALVAGATDPFRSPGGMTAASQPQLPVAGALRITDAAAPTAAPAGSATASSPASATAFASAVGANAAANVDITSNTFTVPLTPAGAAVGKTVLAVSPAEAPVLGLEGGETGNCHLNAYAFAQMINHPGTQYTPNVGIVDFSWNDYLTWLQAQRRKEIEALAHNASHIDNLVAAADAAADDATVGVDEAVHANAVAAHAPMEVDPVEEARELAIEKALISKVHSNTITPSLPPSLSLFPFHLLFRWCTFSFCEVLYSPLYLLIKFY
jgi:hypothetical protein